MHKQRRGSANPFPNATTGQWSCHLCGAHWARAADPVSAWTTHYLTTHWDTEQPPAPEETT